jgi:outer membrane lipoprotein-sorting protein
MKKNRVFLTFLMVFSTFFSFYAVVFEVNAQQKENNKPNFQVKFSSEQILLLNMAQDYLAKIKTLEANFVQINPDNSLVSSGKFLISKPGRLKMSYYSPFKIDYYVSGDNLLQYDHDLDEVTRGEAPENPLKILLYDKVTLANNSLMQVTNIVDEGQSFSVFLVSRTESLREITGLILKFRKTPIEVMSIQRVDNEGNRTSTDLTAVKLNPVIADEDINFIRPKSAFPKSK